MMKINLLNDWTPRKPLVPATNREIFEVIVMALSATIVIAILCWPIAYILAYFTF